MPNRRLPSDEIKEQLQGLTRYKCVAFAVRSAMRVLPLRALQHSRKRPVLWLMEEERNTRNLGAVFRVYGCNVEYVLTGRYMSSAVYAAASAAASSSVASSSASDAASYSAAAYAAYIATAAATDATYAYAAASAIAAATDAATALATSANMIFQEIQRDLALLKTKSASELLRLPLWSTPPPENWQQLWADFKSDALSLNAGFEVWLNWYEDRLQGKPVDVELLTQWNSVPVEIQEQGAARVNAYLKNLLVKAATHPLNRVRAIFIGYGEAGKTSLIRALNGEPVVEGKEAETPGVDIRDWSIPGSEIKAHFWDFGGQVMAHATHQFFLRSSCLYVLVLNARSEIDGTEQAEYWLEHVKSFGKDAPVMIVGNKSEPAGLNLDMSYLKDKYPNIVDLYPVSCTQAKTKYKARFDSFKQDFCQQLRQLGTHQMMFTREQFAVLEELHQHAAQAAFLKHQQFIDLCTAHGIGTEGVQNRDWLLDILDKLGVVIHFPQLPFLDEYVLNPRWLTHGVYTLMYERKAHLTLHDAVAALRAKPIQDEQGNILDYPAARCHFILDAMQEFKLCYPLPQDRNALIIPELLPTDQPADIPFIKQGALAFEFVFRGFLPRHIMPELIVSRHEEIEGEIVWQRGVLLQHKTFQAQALLQVDYHGRVLSIWVNGRDAKDYLSFLNDEVLKILNRLDLNYKEWVTLPLSACLSDKTLIKNEEKAPYRQILAFASEGERIYISESRLKYDLGQVLGIILPDAKNIHVAGDYVEEQKVSNQNVTITNSTVHGSVIAAETIENSFNSLENSSVGDEAKALLAQLLNEIRLLNNTVPAVQAQQLEDMSEETEKIIRESGREAPRKKYYEFSLDGIKDAALTLGAIANPVLEIVKQLSPFLL